MSDASTPYQYQPYQGGQAYAQPAYSPSQEGEYYQPYQSHGPSSPSRSSGIHFKEQKPGVCPPMTRIIVSVSLVAFTAIAAYFCFSYGFNRYDMAWSSMDKFVGGTLVYMGLAFGTAATANAIYGLYKTVFSHKEYTSQEATIQIALTAFAPLAFIPAALCSGVLAAGGR